MTTAPLARAAGFGGRSPAHRLRPRAATGAGAVGNPLGGPAPAAQPRAPAIMGGAAAAIFAKGRDFTGRRRRGDPAPAAEGATGFERFAAAPGEDLQSDFFLPADTPSPAARSGPGAERRRGVIREGEA